MFGGEKSTFLIAKQSLQKRVLINNGKIAKNRAFEKAKNRVFGGSQNRLNPEKTGRNGRSARWERSIQAKKSFSR